MILKNDAIEVINSLGKQKVPFQFYCDFKGERWVIERKEGKRSFQLSIGKAGMVSTPMKVIFKAAPPTYDQFLNAFNKVIGEINYGNSFLTNLTFKTPIEVNLTLSDIFKFTTAKYKLVANDFVVFSPETFLKIEGNRIFSHPMKGTINAAIKNARDTILNDEKETAEHVTIVDLIRNDISQVACNVQVTRFRYIEEIRTNQKNLLQVSSEIIGKLPHDWHHQLGTLLTQLLPAGSISGAPKPQTLAIIHAVENYSRGFYTGICGEFDGSKLDTGVMIRFIGKENDQLYYYSGGGITSFSDPRKEYQEMIDKIYLPS